MSVILRTRELNVLRALLGKQSFTAEEVAQLDFHALRHLPGAGPKSIEGIRAWLADQGFQTPHWRNDDEPGRRKHLAQRIDRASKLLTRHGYTVLPPRDH